MNLRSRLGERFADIWTLLSDTDRFLSRVFLLERYQTRLRDWRTRLAEARGDPEKTKAIRQEIVAVRKALREDGWELRLGTIDVVARGFRSDDAVVHGFSRIVISLHADGSINYISGSENHIELAEQLRLNLQSRRVGGSVAAHYLWYRVSHGLIEFAGADSESKEDFEAFQTILEIRKSEFLRAFKGLS